tara:strand:- start:165 stop:599 length:435 start_codon:yes stop_codon:yes gene_type:complete
VVEVVVDLVVLLVNLVDQVVALQEHQNQVQLLQEDQVILLQSVHHKEMMEEELQDHQLKEVDLEVEVLEALGVMHQILVDQVDLEYQMILQDLELLMQLELQGHLIHPLMEDQLVVIIQEMVVVEVKDYLQRTMELRVDQVLLL